MIIDTDKFKDIILLAIKNTEDQIFRQKCTNLLNMVDTVENQYEMWFELVEKNNAHKHN